eukprot:2417393-Pyramimonas_sp.AAC.1
MPCGREGRTANVVPDACRPTYGPQITLATLNSSRGHPKTPTKARTAHGAPPGDYNPKPKTPNQRTG